MRLPSDWPAMMVAFNFTRLSIAAMQDVLKDWPYACAHDRRDDVKVILVVIVGQEQWSEIVIVV